MGSPARLGAIALAVPFIAALCVAFAAGASGAISIGAFPVTVCGTSPFQTGQTVDGVTLNPAQMSDAQVIYDVSVTLDLPQQAAVIAEATAMQESRLINLPYGTDDSLGLFQQRPSEGWGTPAEIMQPVYASTKFYDALVKVPGWQSLPLTVAAQAVQGSAHPGAYAKWQTLADALVATFNGTADDCLTDNGTGVPQSGTTRLPAGFTLPAGTPQAVVTAIAYAVEQLGKPVPLRRHRPGRLRLLGPGHDGLPRRRDSSSPSTTYQQVYSGDPITRPPAPARRPGLRPWRRRHPCRPRARWHYILSALVIHAPLSGRGLRDPPRRHGRAFVAIRRSPARVGTH